MLGHDPWRHRTIYSAIVAFGSIFNGLQFKRDDRNIEVPVRYVSQDKGEARRKEQVGTMPDFWQIVPRMSYWISDAPQYSAERNRNQLNKIRVQSDDDEERSFFYYPAPFIMTFEANILTRYEDDMWQIQEQVLPFFRPDYTVSVYDPTEGTIDIPFTLTGSNLMHDMESGADEPVRRLEWTMTFDALIYLWGPEQRSKVIRRVDVDLEEEYESDTYRVVETVTEEAE